MVLFRKSPKGLSPQQNSTLLSPSPLTLFPLTAGQDVTQVNRYAREEQWRIWSFTFNSLFENKILVMLKL